MQSTYMLGWWVGQKLYGGVGQEEKGAERTAQRIQIPLRLLLQLIRRGFHGAVTPKNSPYQLCPLKLDRSFMTVRGKDLPFFNLIVAIIRLFHMS